VPRASRADWRALDRSIEGEVLLPQSEAYEWARKPFIARFDEIKPRAVIRCAAAEDVREVIAFARNNGIHVAVRGGGHCVAGYSSTRGIVIDLAQMNSVAVTAGMARVGAGTRIGELCEALDEHGLAIPTGTCPSVGLAGLTLGGGLGILGRAYGLTSDSLLAAQVVLADGRIAECDEHHHADLFWALRGAGAGNFGVVTGFAFAPRAAPRMTNFHLIWSFSDAAAVLSAWQAWAPYGPDELAADLVLTAAGDERAEPSLEIYGAVIGSERDGRGLLTALTARAGADPRSAECRELSYRNTCAYQAERSVAYDRVEQTPHGTRKRQGYRVTKSEFFARPLPATATAKLIATFATPRQPGQSRSIAFMPWGGAYNGPSPQTTAFVHRDQLFLVEHEVVLDPSAPALEKHAAHEWIDSSWHAVHPWGSGRVYPCFPDADLDNPGPAYHGENYTRLLKIKARYDPHNTFRFGQSIPVG
jgi:FAD/FMN-containing dehydrogenase